MTEQDLYAYLNLCVSDGHEKRYQRMLSYYHHNPLGSYGNLCEAFRRRGAAVAKLLVKAGAL